MSPVYPLSQAAHDDAVVALLAELGTVPGQISTALAARTVAAGAGLSGGGTLAADRTLSLSAGSVASLARADTAIQPADITVISGGTP